MGGQIVDATVVAAPRQKLTDDEKATIRGGGGTPAHWAPARRAQKDIDARWTIKRGRKQNHNAPSRRGAVEIAVPVFGYKNHIGTDRRFGLIRRWVVTDAAAHDSRPLRDLIDRTNLASQVWADTAYRSKATEAWLERRGFVSMIQFRRAPGRALDARHARANAVRAKVRSKIEHVFAAQKHRFGLFVRTIGLARATLKIGMANLVYNFTRLAWLERAAAAG
jgi:IS5 family transposase